MLQSQLKFSASKRTSSTSNIAKSKIAKPAAASRVVPKSPLKKPTRKTDSGDEETDDYDDIETPDISEEEEKDEIKEISPPVEDTTDELKRDPPIVEEVQVSTPKTRSQTKKVFSGASASVTKKGSSTKLKDASSKTASPTPFKPSNLKSEDLAKKVEINASKENESDGPQELNPNSAKWNKEYGAAKAKMGGVPAIHAKGHNKVHDILRVFDNSHEYGPCLGISRLDRWERADALGLNPPKEIFEILTTKQGLSLDEYKETVFHNEV